MSGGTQEGWRWKASGYHGATISVIEPATEDKGTREPTVPFGFARILQPTPSAQGTPDSYWEGMGL